VIAGWRAVLLAPILVPVALIAQLLPGKRTFDRSPAEVAGFLRDFLDGTGGEWDWDEFECVPITNPELDRIRLHAAMAGPPGADLAKLRELLAQAEALA
jgi:hypothetical protein